MIEEAAAIQVEKEKIWKTQADISVLEQALEQYSLDMYDYPSDITGLDALLTRPTNLEAQNYRPGGYIKRLSKDPWGKPYLYNRSAGRSGGPYDVYSAGPDGIYGNADDIGNWDPS